MPPVPDSSTADGAPGLGMRLVHELFVQLQRRGFANGAPDLLALRDALSAGFGWSSRQDFLRLIVALWAKSPREAQVVQALFAQQEWPAEWGDDKTASTLADGGAAATPGDGGATPSVAAGVSPTPPEAALPKPPTEDSPQVRQLGNLPPLSLDGVQLGDARLVHMEQFPMSQREIAQAFRRLRRPQRSGPAVELDLDATIARRSRSGVVTPPVLVPRRRNSVRLALFIDCARSMTPYRPWITDFCEAVESAGLLQLTQRWHFQDLPVAGLARPALLDLPPGGFLPPLDSVLSQIDAAEAGELFVDATLDRALPLREVLRQLAPGTVALVISDAGAARGAAELTRLHDSLAFAKGLRRHTVAQAWLNPVPRRLWAHSVAARLARHVPMFEMDRQGVHQSVDTLRGQPATLERPL